MPGAVCVRAPACGAFPDPKKKNGPTFLMSGADEGDRRSLSGDEPDEVLATAAKAGDDDAFGALYRRHAPSLFDFLTRTVRDRTTAEDLLQSTFVRAIERRSDLREPAKVRSWLFSIAHHLAMNHLTRTRPTEVIQEQSLRSEESEPEAALRAGEAAELVWAAAAALEARQYAVLDLSLRQQLSTVEVAEALEVNPRHAAVVLHRAKEALAGAVRALLVARSAERCDRLAALVPTIPRSFSPTLRVRVDHHLRRCLHCKSLASKLSSPEALLAGLPPIALPAHLISRGWARVLGRTGHGLVTPPLDGGDDAPPRESFRAGRRGIGRRFVVLGVAVLAILGTGVAVGIGTGGPSHRPLRSPGPISALRTTTSTTSPPTTTTPTPPSSTAAVPRPPPSSSTTEPPTTTTTTEPPTTTTTFPPITTTTIR